MGVFISPSLFDGSSSLAPPQGQRQLGTAPAVLYVAGGSGVFSLEELLELLGSAPRESLLPPLAQSSSPDAPT